MPSDVTRTESLAHFPMGIFDSGELEVRLSIIADRIIDITDICPETQRSVGQTVLKYGRSKRGVIAQVVNRFKPGIDYGSRFHNFPDEKGIAGLATDEILIRHARFLGCDSLTLAETIIEFLPAYEDD